MAKKKVAAAVEEVYGQISAFDLACASYLEYAQYVNRFRLIPNAGDGLLPVYRRTLLAAAKYPKMTLTNSIVSDCCRDWHPHGSQSVEPVVSNMVRHKLLAGKGNHGARLMRTVKAAAPRYTKTGAIKEVTEVLFKLKEYAPHFMNEVNNNEPMYLITPVPISLVFGHMGLGVGVTTRIPAFTYESLVKAYRTDNPAHLRCQYGYQLEGGEIADLWHHGVGRIRCSMNIEYEWSDDDGCYVSIITGSGELFTPKLGLLDEHIAHDRVFIRDESGKEIRIVIGRTKGTRAISDDRIYEIAKQACTFDRKYDIRAVVGKSVKRIGIRDWLSLTMNLYADKYKAWQDDRTADLKNKIFQQVISQDVGNFLSQDFDNDQILEYIGKNITSGDLDSKFSGVLEQFKRDPNIDDIKEVCKKSMSNLRKNDYEKNCHKLLSELDAVLSATSERAIDEAASVIKMI
ncbi:DNA topoisomerase, type IIA subunit A [Vibrio phage 150E35-1]|nr:DNA topoisomerase, type IIA subunit A [Vibrio phage 150E35-1]